MAMTAQERLERLKARKQLVQTQRGLLRTRKQAERLGIPVEPEEPKESVFHEILDVLNRPQQGFFQAIEGFQKGEDATTVLEQVWGGLSGSVEKVHFGDILSNAGMRDGKLKATSALVGDLVLDPINLVPFGAASKVTKAAKIRMLATPEGRRTMAYVGEALRTAPVLGGSRRLLNRMFSTRPLFREDPTQPFVKSVEKRLDELEHEDLVAAGKAIGRGEAPPAPQVLLRDTDEVELIGPRGPFSVRLGEVDKAIAGADLPGLGKLDMNEQVKMIRRMAEIHKEGRLPHELLADYIQASKKSAMVARQAVATKWIPMIRQFYNDSVNPLSKRDQELVIQVGEEAGIVDAAVRKEKVQALLGQAEDWRGVYRAGLNYRKMYERLEQLELDAGIKVARLGGTLRKRMEDEYRRYEKLIEDATFKEWTKTAQQIRTTAFGTRVAQKQAFALADLMDQVGKGSAQRSDLLHFLEEADALRGGLTELRKSKIAPLGRASRELKRRGMEVRGQDAYQILVDDILDANVAAGKDALIARRTNAMKRMQKLLDRVPGYVLHYLDDDAAEWLAANIGKNPKIARAMGSIGHRSLIERKWIDEHGVPLSLQDIQTIVDEGDAAALADYGRGFLRRRRSWLDIFRGDDGKIGDYFGLDAASALAIRTQRTARAISGTEFRNSMERMFGGYSGPNSATIPGFRGRFAPELRQIIADMDEAYFGDAATKTFLRFYDGAQMIWKGFTLFPFAAYHTRNVLGDHWLMSIGGFYTRDTRGKNGILEPFYRALPDHEAFTDLIRAHRMQVHLTTGNVDALQSIKMTLPDGRSYDGVELYEAVRRRGGVGIGFHSDNIQAAAETEVKLTNALWKDGKFRAGEIPRRLADVADLRTWVMPSEMPRNALIRGGRWMAQAISDTNRMAFVMKRLRMGDTLDDAVDYVKKWLLDYSDLTPFETQVGRRVMPFYMWLRKNTPRQFEALLNSPQKLARIGHLARFARSPDSPLQPFYSMLGGPGSDRPLTEEELPRPVDLPEWMRKAVAFPLRRNADGEIEMITIAAWHPAAELQRVAPSTVGKTFLDQMSPLLKVPLETAMKRNLFFDQELMGTTEFLGREMPATWANALQNVRLLAEFDRLNWFSGLGFSTRYLRPETEEETAQKWLRLFTGAKIYPLDTRMAKARNLEPILRRRQLRIRKERAARIRARQKERQK